MYCEDMVASVLSCRDNAPKSKPIWQYHPRSDHHSKVLSAALLIDLISECKTLQRHIKNGAVRFGINHTITDKTSGNTKDLDLVILSPDRSSEIGNQSTLLEYISGIPNLRESSCSIAKATIEHWGKIKRAQSGGLLMTIEAKAIMTEFGKAFPRFYDELSSSQRIVCNSGLGCITAAAVMINHSDEFISPTIAHNNTPEEGKPKKSSNHQNKLKECYQNKLLQLPMKNNENPNAGYDEVLAIDIFMRNDGSKVKAIKNFKKPDRCDHLTYSRSIKQLSTIYTEKWRDL